jgi:hypothetical protein
MATIGVEKGVPMRVVLSVCACFWFACGDDDGDDAGDGTAGVADAAAQPDAAAEDAAACTPTTVELLINGGFDDATAPMQAPWSSTSTMPAVSALVMDAAQTGVTADTEPNIAVFGQYLAPELIAVDSMTEAIGEVPAGVTGLHLEGQVYVSSEEPEGSNADVAQIVLRTRDGEDLEVLAKFTTDQAADDFTLVPFAFDSATDPATWTDIPLSVWIDSIVDTKRVSSFAFDSLSLTYETPCP